MYDNKSKIEFIILILILLTLFINLYYLIAVIVHKKTTVKFTYKNSIVAVFDNDTDCKETLKNIQKNKQNLYRCVK